MAERPFCGTETYIPPPSRGTSLSERNDMSSESKSQPVIVTAIDVQAAGEYVTHPAMTDDDLHQEVRCKEKQNGGRTGLNGWQVECATEALCTLAASGRTGLSIEQTGIELTKALIALNRSKIPG